MKKNKLSLLLLILTVIGTVSAMNEVDFFNGMITVDDYNVSVDTVLKAYVNSENIKNFTLTSAGEYGIQIVNGQGASPEENVSFMIYDLFSNELTLLDLTQVFLARPLNLTFNDTTDPSTPGNVTVSEILNISLTNSSLNITWSASTDNIWTDLFYNVYLGDSSEVTSATGTLLTQTNSTSYTYSDSLKPQGSTKYIVVYANDTSGNVGSKSTAASVTLTNRIPKPATNLSASSGDETIDLSWDAVTENTDNSTCDDLSGYRIYTNASGSWSLLNSTTDLTFQDTSLNNGLTYYYRIASYDSDGNQGDNVSTSATPAAGPTLTALTNSSFIMNETSLVFNIITDGTLDYCSYQTYVDDSANTSANNASCAAPYLISLGPLAEDDNTSYVVNIYANNSNGAETNLNFSYTFDTSDPTTTDNAPSGWQNANINITLTQSDSISGILATLYCTDTGNNCTPNITYTDSVIVSAQGNQYFRYYSSDNAGNTQSIVSRNIKLDKTAPTTSDDFSFNGTWKSSAQIITLTPACTISGCNWTKYCTDSNNTCVPSTNYTSPINITGEGTTYLRYASEDNASNTQSTVSLQVLIDLTAPTVNLVTSDNGYVDDSTPGFIFNVSDNLGSSLSCLLDINSSYYALNASTALNTATSLTANTSVADGLHSWNILCEDPAGNSNNVSTGRRNIRLDTSAPVLLTNSSSVSIDIGGTAAILTSWNDQYLELGNITCSLYVNGALDSSINSTSQWCNFTHAIGSADYPYTVFSVRATDSLSHSTNSSNMTTSVNLSCSSSITSSLTMVADLDCSGESSNGLVLANEVTLDCAGYQIIGSGSLTGILSANNTMTNCHISSWTTGLSVNGSNNVLQSSIIDNCSTGIAIVAGSGNNISGNNLTSNTVGIQLDSDGNNLIDNRISTCTTAVQGNGVGTTWYINNRAILTDNNATINGLIEFNSGVLELIESYITLNSIFVNMTGNISELPNNKINISENITMELDFADTNISLNLAGNVSSSLVVYSETPLPSGITAGLTALKGVEVLVDSQTEGNLTWALIEITYNDSEISGMVESRLRMYYYNETSGDWQLEPTQGVNTENNFIWANVTHFSLFGVFESAAEIIPSRSGGSRVNTLRQINICAPDIACSAWSDCVQNSKTRTCVDYNGCTENRTENRACAPPIKKKVPVPTKQNELTEVTQTEETVQNNIQYIEEQEVTPVEKPSPITGMASTDVADEEYPYSYVIGFIITLGLIIAGLVTLIVLKRSRQ
ncbi:hypothetical protein HQ545_07705 [Candidatus Woesearchaeota archaeon]|nr:hypothetical protein [Candidatus Woesearchaeota archaeon]